jgi:glyoxylate/hydroxypyruvate reductase
MNISFCCTNVNPKAWLAELSAALPEHHIAVWNEQDPASNPPAHAAIVWSPPQTFFDQQPQLQVAFNIGAGVDALLQKTLPADLSIIRLDDAGMSVQMAEYVVQAVVRYFRELPTYEQDMREGEWSFKRPRERGDFTVGIMGLGVLGQRVAKALQHFEYPVAGWSLSPKTLDGVTTFAGDAQLPQFLQACSVVVCVLPLTPATRHILQRSNLMHLRAGAYLINVSRGEHMVEADVLALLNSGHLAGATLDVFTTEPLPPEHPFRHHANVTCTPHAAARTLRGESVTQIATKFKQWAAGTPAHQLSGFVDRARGY